MKTHTKRLITATLITPWAVIPVTALYSIWYLITWLGKPLPDPAVTLIWPHPFKPWESIFLYSMYGVPTAYVALIFIGLPCYFFAKGVGYLSYTAAILTAVLACIPAAALYGGSDHFWRIFGFLLFFGVPMAIIFTWILNRPNTSVNTKPLPAE